MKYKKIMLICMIFLAVNFYIEPFSSVVQVQGQAEVNKEQAQENNNENSEEKLYGIGSVSKVYTAAAVLKLVDEGKLNIDDPVVKYIPDFQMDDPRYRNITVRMLLNHSSGLNGGTICNTILLDDNSTYNHDNLLELLKSKKLKADPGQYSVYCNDGFTLAEILVERVSGMSFTEFLEKEICGPLGLKNTKTPQSDMSDNSLQKIYFDNSSLELPKECANVIGSGGLYSTSEDMCRFSQIFMNSNDGFLSKKSLDLMMESSRNNTVFGIEDKDSTWDYGLGWDSINAYPFNKYNIRALSKGGDTNNYHGNLTVLPDNNMSAAVVSSGGSDMINQMIAQELLEAALEYYGIIDKGSDYEELSDYNNSSIIPEEIKENAGVYCGDGMFKVTFDNNRLILSTDDKEINVTQEYKYIGDGYFISTNENYISPSKGITSSENGYLGNTKLYFKKESNGKTYIYIESYESYPGLSHTAALMPYAQKVEENNISDHIMDVWKKRSNKKYYLISEKYTSAYYLLKDRIKVKIGLSEIMPGYLKSDFLLKNNKIVDENYAEDFIKIPGTLGRDTNDISFYKKGDTEYAKVLGMNEEFICEDSIDYIDFEKESINIGKDNAKWFKINKQDEGKQVSIKINGKGSYFVYDKYDNCIDISAIKNKDNNIVLPKEGKILFTGEEGTEFDFNLQ